MVEIWKQLQNHDASLKCWSSSKPSSKDVELLLVLQIVATLKDDVTQITASLRNSSQVRKHHQDQMTQNAAPHRPMSGTGNASIHAKHPNTPDIFATETTSSTSLKSAAAPPKSVMSLVAQWESKAKGIGYPASTKSARPLTWKSRWRSWGSNSSLWNSCNIHFMMYFVPFVLAFPLKALLGNAFNQLLTF